MNYNKLAITYSLLAHIRNSGELSSGPLDLFVPIVKKGLHLMNEGGQYKGENISELEKLIEKEYAIDIPVPVLNNILKIIADDINRTEKLFELYQDGSFWIKNYTFCDYDEEIKESEKDIKELQKLFKNFCTINSVNGKDNKCIIKFIEKHKMNLSQFLSDKIESNGTNYYIEAKFVEYFKETSVYDKIKNIYIGSILTSYLVYEPKNINMKIDLLFDTNFIVSLLDLNTPESTHTCSKLIEIGNKLGFSYHILNDTINEVQGLLQYKAENFENSVIQKYINKEDIYNACNRLNYSRTDLERISDNIKEKIESFGIIILHNTEKYRNIAKYSEEYKKLCKYRNSEKSALHDATCIAYVKNKRNKTVIRNFEKVNCWFVNNAISHDYEDEHELNILNNNRTKMPEIIRVDNLLNILWLSSPILTKNFEIADIGLTSLVASTLNKSLPKSRIIKELDDNIQKYKDSKITDRDVLLLSMRIANNQIKNVDELNKLAETDSKKFNQRVKYESTKQDNIENEKAIKLANTVEKLSDAIKTIHRNSSIALKDKDEELKKNLKIQELEKLLKEKEKLIKEKGKKEFIDQKVKKWQNNSKYLFWFFCIAFMVLLYFCFKDYLYGLNTLNQVMETKFWLLMISLFPFIVNIILFKVVYDRYYNYSNIKSYKNSIQLPDELM